MINGVREKISLFKQPQALKGPSWLMSGGQAAYTPALVGLEIVVPLEEPFTAGCFCALRRKLCRERERRQAAPSPPVWCRSHKEAPRLSQKSVPRKEERLGESGYSAGTGTADTAAVVSQAGRVPRGGQSGEWEAGEEREPAPRGAASLLAEPSALLHDSVLILVSF